MYIYIYIYICILARSRFGFDPCPPLAALRISGAGSESHGPRTQLCGFLLFESAAICVIPLV